MALMERVSALIRANLNDLIDKAEEPEKMLRQVIVDMENQLIQVKTQVAVAIADEHLLARKVKENEAKRADWMRKADLALDRADDALARAAIERADTCRLMGEALDEQMTDQRNQTETLRGALRKLDAKLAEARAKAELLIAQHRRSRTMRKATEAQSPIAGDKHAATFDRMRRKVLQGDAVAAALVEIAAASVDERFEELEKNDRVEALLAELKSRRQISA
jgi:phage shock protein A